MSLRNFKTVDERRKFVEKSQNISFSAISIYPKGLEEAQFRNCENMIGAVQIPTGIAGPLRIVGETGSFDSFIPLTTTEGALVASVNRGCKAISTSGGVNVFVDNKGITRGPVFRTKGLKHGKETEYWLKRNFSKLAKLTEKTSSHLKLIKLDTAIVGQNIYLRFVYDTQDAMGMNMATFATEKAVKLIEEETEAVCISLAGNFDLDKKPSWSNFILGRGKRVWAEATFTRKIVTEVLKTTPEKIHELAIRKCLLGSALSGSLGFNAHFANIVAAIFLATGQDAAHIVEGSLGITSTEIVGDSLYISVYLPDLPIGVVGGGTYLPAQREMLDILKVSGGDEGRNAIKFAQIIGAAVLAGEISLLASLAEGSLSSVHKKLARGGT